MKMKELLNLQTSVIDLITNPTAVIVYVIVILVLVVVLVIYMIINLQNSSTLPNHNALAALGEFVAQGKSKKEIIDTKKTRRFNVLLQLDADKDKIASKVFNDQITLEEICNNFRDYSANVLKLYYDIKDIRRFIASLAVSHTMILQGMSGTGKTSLAFAFGEFIDNTSTIISVQPMWKERSDLLGYYNEFTKKFNETELLRKTYEANYSKDMFIVVLDEMNIARVEYYFAEFLSKLEIPNLDERELEVVSDTWESDPKLLKQGKILLPNNMWFIGTANNDDSTFAISDKVYDRAMILNLDYRAKPFKAPKVEKMHISAERFLKIVEDDLEEYEISERNLLRIRQLDEYLIKNFHITFGNRIMKQIKTYVPIYEACGGDELEAIDDILAKKVLRKLESQNPIYIKEASKGFIEYLDSLFGENEMSVCKEFMLRLQKSI